MRMTAPPQGARSWRRLQAVAVSGSASEGLLLAALPLLAVSVTTDPRKVSLVSAVGQAPWLLLSLFAGVAVDRIRRTTLLTWGFAGQGCAALALALAGTTGRLTLPLLLATAFVVTSTQVLGEGASGALLPEIVPPAELAAANTRLQMISRGAVQFAVPPVTGLFLAFSAGAPAWMACAMAASALVLSRGIDSEAPASSGAHPLRDMAEGLRYLVGTPLLRWITVVVCLGAFSASASNAMLVLYATRVLHIGAFGYGALLACMATGFLISSFFVSRVVGRLGWAWSMRSAQCILAVIQLAMALIPAWSPAVAALLALLAGTALLWNVCSQSSRQRFTPPALLGRVLTSHRALSWGLTPLGALAGGMIATRMGLRAVWLMGAVAQAAAAAMAWHALSPDAFRDAEQSTILRQASAPGQSTSTGSPVAR
jgi:predicted MFS family arabinose efflux permease